MFALGKGDDDTIHIVKSYHGDRGPGRLPIVFSGYLIIVAPGMAKDTEKGVNEETCPRQLVCLLCLGVHVSRGHVASDSDVS